MQRISVSSLVCAILAAFVLTQSSAFAGSYDTDEGLVVQVDAGAVARLPNRSDQSSVKQICEDIFGNPMSLYTAIHPYFRSKHKTWIPIFHHCGSLLGKYHTEDPDLRPLLLQEFNLERLKPSGSHTSTAEYLFRKETSPTTPLTHSALHATNRSESTYPQRLQQRQYPSSAGSSPATSSHGSHSSVALDAPFTPPGQHSSDLSYSEAGSRHSSRAASPNLSHSNYGDDTPSSARRAQSPSGDYALEYSETARPNKKRKRMEEEQRQFSPDQEQQAGTGVSPGYRQDTPSPHAAPKSLSLDSSPLDLSRRYLSDQHRSDTSPTSHSLSSPPLTALSMMRERKVPAFKLGSQQHQQSALAPAKNTEVNGSPESMTASGSEDENSDGEEPDMGTFTPGTSRRRLLLRSRPAAVRSSGQQVLALPLSSPRHFQGEEQQLLSAAATPSASSSAGRTTSILESDGEESGTDSPFPFRSGVQQLQQLSQAGSAAASPQMRHVDAPASAAGLKRDQQGTSLARVRGEKVGFMIDEIEGRLRTERSPNTGLDSRKLLMKGINGRSNDTDTLAAGRAEPLKPISTTAGNDSGSHSRSLTAAAASAASGSLVDHEQQADSVTVEVDESAYSRVQGSDDDHEALKQICENIFGNPVVTYPGLHPYFKSVEDGRYIYQHCRTLLMGTGPKKPYLREPLLKVLTHRLLSHANHDGKIAFQLRFPEEYSTHVPAPTSRRSSLSSTSGAASGSAHFGTASTPQGQSLSFGRRLSSRVRSADLPSRTDGQGLGAAASSVNLEHQEPPLTAHTFSAAAAPSGVNSAAASSAAAAPLMSTNHPSSDSALLAQTSQDYRSGHLGWVQSQVGLINARGGNAAAGSSSDFRATAAAAAPSLRGAHSDASAAPQILRDDQLDDVDDDDPFTPRHSTYLTTQGSVPRAPAPGTHRAAGTRGGATSESSNEQEQFATATTLLPQASSSPLLTPRSNPDLDRKAALDNSYDELNRLGKQFDIDLNLFVGSESEKPGQRVSCSRKPAKKVTVQVEPENKASKIRQKCQKLSSRIEAIISDISTQSTFLSEQPISVQNSANQTRLSKTITETVKELSQRLRKANKGLNEGFYIDSDSAGHDYKMETNKRDSQVRSKPKKSQSETCENTLTDLERSAKKIQKELRKELKSVPPESAQNVKSSKEQMYSRIKTKAAELMDLFKSAMSVTESIKSKKSRLPNFLRPEIKRADELATFSRTFAREALSNKHFRNDNLPKELDTKLKHQQDIIRRVAGPTLSDDALADYQEIAVTTQDYAGLLNYYISAIRVTAKRLKLENELESARKVITERRLKLEAQLNGDHANSNSEATKPQGPAQVAREAAEASARAAAEIRATENAAYQAQNPGEAQQKEYARKARNEAKKEYKRVRALYEKQLAADRIAEAKAYEEGPEAKAQFKAAQEAADKAERSARAQRPLGQAVDY